MSLRPEFTTRSLLAAADSRRRDGEAEDRLTELLREVLLTSPLLTAWFFERAFGAPTKVPAWCAEGEYSVDTQTALSGGGRPDMEIRPRDGSRRGPLYVENKIRAPFTKRQTEGYLAIPDSSRVLVISPQGDRRPCGDPKFVPVSWSEVGRQANALGRTWADESDWMSRAFTPNAPAQYRLLAEFLIYLEGEDVDVSIEGPLNEGDWSALPSMRDRIIRWKQLRDRIIARLEAANGAPVEVDRRWDPEKRGQEKIAFAITLRSGDGWEGSGWPSVARVLPTPKWSWQEVIVAPLPPWNWARLDVPFVAVGVGCSGLPPLPEDDPDWLELRDEIETIARMGLSNRKSLYRILSMAPLEEVVAGSETLEDQAEAVVSRVSNSLTRLVAL